MPACSECGQAVFHAEQAYGPAGKVYHKSCLKCQACKKTLAAGQWQDHDGQPYCKACHAKNFGPKGYGISGLTGEYVDRFLPVRKMEQAQTSSPTRSQPVFTPSFMKQSPQTDKNTASRAADSVDNRCPRCKTVVYAAEQALAVGMKWHKYGFSALLDPKAQRKQALSEVHQVFNDTGSVQACRARRPTVNSSSFKRVELGLTNATSYCSKCYSSLFGTGSLGLLSRPGLF